MIASPDEKQSPSFLFWRPPIGLPVYVTLLCFFNFPGRCTTDMSSVRHYAVVHTRRVLFTFFLFSLLAAFQPLELHIDRSTDDHCYLLK